MCGGTLLFIIDLFTSYLDRNQNEKVSIFNIDIHDFTSLKKLAFLSGIYSRFKLDKNLPSNCFYDLYAIWIKKSINLDLNSLVRKISGNKTSACFFSFNIFFILSKYTRVFSKAKLTQSQS